MRHAFLIASILFISCDLLDNKKNRTETFCLKFINAGTYDITAFYLKPVADTVSWGESMLTVTRLKNLEYVLFPNVKAVGDYAFKTVFDSAGSPAFRTCSEISTVGSPDTITAHSGLGTYSNKGDGYNWGLRIWDGEVLR
jgi:hypothetical protein